MIILGVMSGSSLDGLDMALIDINEVDDGRLVSDYLHWYTFPLSYLKHDLSRLNSQSSLRDYFRVESDYSSWIAEKIIHFLSTVSITPEYISVHGHTVSHIPEKGISAQLNIGGMIAAKTGIPTITDFRQGDIALGGKGTPLTPIMDKYFYSQYDLVVNLGGICNVSYRSNDTTYGYDLFPCNQVSNYYAKKQGKDFDEDGAYGMTGRLDDTLYEALITHRFLNESAPKAIDNDWIKGKFIPEIEYFNIRNEDKLFTFYVAFSQILINHAVEIGAKTILVSGGGIRNTFLRNLILEKASIQKISVVIPSEEDIDYRECKLMALLAFLRVSNRANILKSVTGASRSSIGGAIYI